MTENLADITFEKLGSSKNPAVELAVLYGSIFDRSITKSEIIVFNKLLKLYGRFTVFFAVLDMSSMENINFDNIYPLLSYYCKKRIESKGGKALTDLDYLDGQIAKLEKQIKQLKKNLPVARSIDE